jgi:hypothetical protein
MTEEEFTGLFNRCGADVANRFYPKNGTASEGGARRGEFLRDLGVLCAGLIEALHATGVIEG